jgi:hypothetical protein
MERKYAIELISKQAVMRGVTALMAKHAELSLRITY